MASWPAIVVWCLVRSEAASYGSALRGMAMEISLSNKRIILSLSEILEGQLEPCAA